MKKVILFCLLVISFLGIYAQGLVNILADDVLIREKIKADPTIIDRYVQYEKNFKLLVERSQLNLWLEKTDTLINGKRVIPVVVHIIHNYGQENISDAQVIDAIQKLNIDFSKQNADTALTYHLFKSRAANCAIEFRLAKKDPNGNCTNGIVHIYDPQTNWAYFNTMKQYHWPTDKYMNVFAVNFIYPSGMALPDGAFIGGMSPFPPNNPLSQALTGGDADIDGVLIRQDCIGTIGTATDVGGMGINLANRTFTHEVGHYLNLYHPFQNLMLGLLPASSGCPSFLAPNGDEVSDTPPVAQATQNTSLDCYVPGSRNTCNQDNPDEPDMIENYMDYQWGYCNNIFTNGQKARMDAVLMGIRRPLWSKENLIATGVLDQTPSNCAPIADFHASHYTICAGDQITFYDDSYNGVVENRIWNFTGGNPSSSTNAVTTVTYSTPGTYSVTLTVSNANGQDTKTKTNIIKVIDPVSNIYAPLVQGFENGLGNEWSVVNESGVGWQVTDTASATGVKSARIRNFAGNQPNSVDALISPPINLTSLSPTVTLKLKFKYAYAGKIIPGTMGLTQNDTAYDKMKIYVSTTCGKTWIVKWSKLNEALQTTTNPTQNSFKPTANDWKSDSINIHIYLTQQKTNFQFKFEFLSNGGNNIYIDDINIDNGTYVGMNEYSRDLIDLNVYPNPLLDNSKLSFYLPYSANTKIEVYDIVGNKVIDLENRFLSEGVYEYALSRHYFKASGIYYIRVLTNEHTFYKNLMVK
ncbi:MAG: M43 family zinc metalloprotease [Bacteroidales bacterium]|nr:M43 family zinc metalloprotease [Bacteroidales bacterium]